MTRSSKKDRIAALESDLAQVIDRLDQLEATISDRAPASEIERLNLAFDLIADRAPASEIERLNHAFELIDRPRLPLVKSNVSILLTNSSPN